MPGKFPNGPTKKWLKVLLLPRPRKCREAKGKDKDATNPKSEDRTQTQNESDPSSKQEVAIAADSKTTPETIVGTRTLSAISVVGKDISDLPACLQASPSLTLQRQHLHPAVQPRQLPQRIKARLEKQAKWFIEWPL